MVSWKKEKELERMRIINDHCFDYDQNPSETSLEYKLFNIYRKLGRTRNYIKVCNLYPDKSYSRICQIATKHSWATRAQAWDRDNEKEIQQKLDEEILISRLRQFNIGKQLIDLSEKGLEILSEIPEEMSPNEIVKFAEIGSKLQSLALGKSTEITESKIEAEVKVKVEEIDPDIAKEIGKLIAIKNSEDTK